MGAEVIELIAIEIGFEQRDDRVHEVLERLLGLFARQAERTTGVAQLDRPLHGVPRGCGQHHATLRGHKTLGVKLNTHVGIAGAFEKRFGFFRVQADQWVDQALDIAPGTHGVAHVGMANLTGALDHAAAGLLIFIPQGDQHLAAALDDLQQRRRDVLALIDEHVGIALGHHAACQAGALDHQQGFKPGMAAPGRVRLKVAPQPAGIFEQHPGIDAGERLLEMRQMLGRQAVLPGAAVSLKHLEAHLHHRLPFQAAETKDIQFLSERLLGRHPHRRIQRLWPRAMQ